jgi:hypothetical protein
VKSVFCVEAVLFLPTYVMDTWARKLHCKMCPGFWRQWSLLLLCLSGTYHINCIVSHLITSAWLLRRAGRYENIVSPHKWLYLINNTLWVFGSWNCILHNNKKCFYYVIQWVQFTLALNSNYTKKKISKVTADQSVNLVKVDLQQELHLW